MPNIIHAIPWNSDKCIGKSYNDIIRLIDDESWVCFLDGDAVHTTTYFGKRIEDVVTANSDYQLLTCYTNRIGCSYQLAPGVNAESNDQKYHRIVGEAFWRRNQTKVVDITNNNYLSGVLILIKKSGWQKAGGFSELGMLGVDNDIHKKFKFLNLKVGLMTGIYVQHWYRGGNKNDKSHLVTGKKNEY